MNHERAIAKTDALFTDAGGSPGCALGVIDEGALLFARGYGLANLAEDVPITPRSVFSLASLAKQFTGAAVALLVLRGELSLNDDVRTYVPELPQYEATITIRHLLYHTSGLRDHLVLRDLAGQSPESFFDNEDTIALLSRQRALDFEPGTRYSYGNSGYVLLAEIIERLSGQTLERFTRDNLFDPLGMRSTTWGYDRHRVIPNRVIGYRARPDSAYQSLSLQHHGVGDTNLLSTVEDLFRWDRMFYDTTAVWSPLVELMQSRGTLTNGDTLAYAFGLQHGEYRGRRTVAHRGGVPGWSANMTRFPDDRFTTIALCNSTRGPAFAWTDLADIWLFGDDAQATARDEPAAGRDWIALRREALEGFAGIYRNPETPVVEVEVRPQGTGLRVSGPGFEYMIRPVAATVFDHADVPVSRPHEFIEEDDVLVLQISPPGRSPWRLPQIERPRLSVEQLSAFVGDYYSGELDATWSVWLEGGVLRITGPDWEGRGVLEPLARDRFSFENKTLHFSRGPQDQITGFALRATRGILFEKVREP